MPYPPARSYSLAATLVAGLFLATAVAAQPVIYVDADATGNDDGSSWANAFEELDEALEAAGSSAQIWVAEGVYYPTDDLDRTETFALKNGVLVLGGFVGTETSADQRNDDPGENGTVLSGDIGVAGDVTDNVYHVVTAINVDGTAVLDGFTVTGGNANGPLPGERGGGLTNYDGVTTAPDTEGSPTLRHLVFSGNRALFGGGGVYLNTSPGTVVFEDVAFVENEAGEWGGGLYSRAFIEMESVAFEGNVAGERGGGAHLESRTALIRDAEFDGNRVGTEVLVGRGAGFHIERETRATLINVVFERNTAPLGNRGDGAGFNAEGTAVVDVVNAVFIGNVSRGGAGFTTRGGATVRVTNALFAGNRSQDSEWGIVDLNGTSTTTLANVTIAGNRASGAISTVASGGVSVLNSILWGNTDLAIRTYDTAPVDVDHVIIEGGYPGGQAVLADDPLFLHAPDAGGDGEWGTDDDDYGDLRLGDGSPAIGFGDLDLVPQDEFDLDGDGITGELLPFDLDGEVRVQNGSVELGAYEGVGPLVASAPGASPVGSLALSAAYPNPARGLATLTLTLASSERVEVTVFDVLGRRVARVHEGTLAPGAHPFALDGAALPAGLYVVRAASPSGTATRRVTLIR